VPESIPEGSSDLERTVKSGTRSLNQGVGLDNSLARGPLYDIGSLARV